MLTHDFTRTQRNAIRNLDDLFEEERFDALFLGKVMGVGLGRHEDDESGVSVLVHVLLEDDEFWHVDIENGFGSHWLAELGLCVAAAQSWMIENCKPYRGGWLFKSKRRRKIVKAVFDPN